jgi:hypothetical protein
VNDTTNPSTLTEYDDSYPTCAKTYAELRIYTGKMAPQCVSDALKVRPTKLLVAGEGEARLNGWFLSTLGQVESHDVRRHVDWLLQRITAEPIELQRLQSEPQVWMDVFCYWRSTQGHGGPMLSPKQMQALAELNLTIGFDCY